MKGESDESCIEHLLIDIVNSLWNIFKHRIFLQMK
jgi:hypothetical protein